jgi:DNA-directed RNA polymerase specialized sigma24 family protein
LRQFVEFIEMSVRIEHDGRALSRMDKESRFVHTRLEAWAQWAREFQEARAYPSMSTVGRMMEYGALGASQEGRPPISMPDEIAEVDAAVARLCDMDNRAIKAYYLHWEPIENCAKRLNMNVRPFQSLLRRARWRMTLFLHCEIRTQW